MRTWWAIAAVLACGCGRFGFQDPGEASELSLSYPETDVDAIAGVTALSLAPALAGGPAAFEVSPPLPAGLALDPATGAIAGTPTQIEDGVAHVVTATGAASAVKVVLRLTVLPGFAVDAIADGFDDDGGADPTCFSTSAGGCTLRAAVQTANTQPGKQLILLAARTYVLEDSLGAISDDVAIAGQGAAATAIRAVTEHPGFGVLYVSDPIELALRKLSVRDFGATDGAVVLLKNGRLRVDAASFSNNLSAGSGGVLLARGGTSAVLDRSTFTGNVSEGGCCGGWGGVIHGEDTGTSIIVRRSTASENVAAWGAFSHLSSGATLTLENSTLYRNTSTIAGTLASPGGTYKLIHSTIAHNATTNPSPESAGIYLYSSPASYTVASTILAFNRDATGAERNCHHRTMDTRVTSLGGNLVSDGGGNCAAELVAPGDRLAVDPGLDPNGLGDNGGPTHTILLMPGSIALEAGAGPLCPAEDQRGVVRRGAPDVCDAGAVELP